jgi:CRISPR-associated protein Cas2
MSMRKPTSCVRGERSLVLIAYDTPSDRRRRRIARCSEDVGARVQKSVFQAWVDAKTLESLPRRLGRDVLAAEDSVFIIPCCASCRRRIRLLGLANVWELPRYWIL